MTVLIKFHLPDHDALEKAITKDTAAIMVEFNFGEGGIRVFQMMIGLGKFDCEIKDLLLILDEVQCVIATM